jgi:hypothetical protein
MHRTTRSSTRVVVLLSLVLAAGSSRQAQAATRTYTDQPTWQAAVLGAANVTVFHFDGPTELNGRTAVDPLVTPSYSSQGVDFLPFAGTEVYPELSRGQGYQIPDAARDGLLTNAASPNPTSDLMGRAIRFDVNIPTNAIGVFTNRFPLDSPSGDGGYLEALDAAQNVIGQVDLGAGIFGGLITDVPIAHVNIVNTWNDDIQFGIWDLQFAKTFAPTAVAVAAAAAAARLYPNQPNPFNPQTTLRFDLPEAGRARLVVYDVAGRQVRILVDGERTAGSNEAVWDGRDEGGKAVGSGTYLARLSFNGRIETVRMGLVR